MILYIETLKHGEPGNISFYAGMEAFYNMGFELVEVTDLDQLIVAENNIFFGGIGFVQKALKKLGFEVPEHNDYPPCLSEFYGRKIYVATIDEIANKPESWDVFVKPKGQLKKFTGRHVKSTFDLVGCGDLENNVPVWVSEPVRFVSEWRVFVRYQEILGVRPYKGDWRGQYDYKVMEAAVKAYENAPAGYAIDFGLTDKGQLLVVEVNEGYSIGNYGLFYIDYAKLIATRWAEMTQQADLCNF